MKWIVTLTAMLLTACATQQPTGDGSINVSRLTELDNILRQGQFQKLVVTLTPDKFDKDSYLLAHPSFSTDLLWLERNSNQTYPPLLYVRAYRALRNDVEKAMELYAQARILAFLDAKECRSATRFPWYSFLENTFPELHKERKRNQMKYLNSVSETLRIDSKATFRHSASWYCGKNNLLPTKLAKAARKKKADSLFEYNEAKVRLGKDD
ncbi:MAG: hypothetical protein EP323_06515 [Gammaproteobacteria bacterium]|nr:MAG: hypothetical protein EP323_06515 [Gammaproteobacteria bacterium]